MMGPVAAPTIPWSVGPSIHPSTHPATRRSDHAANRGLPTPQPTYTRPTPCAAAALRPSSLPSPPPNPLHPHPTPSHWPAARGDSCHRSQNKAAGDRAQPIPNLAYTHSYIHSHPRAHYTNTHRLGQVGRREGERALDRVRHGCWPCLIWWPMGRMGYGLGLCWWVCLWKGGMGESRGSSTCGGSIGSSRARPNKPSRAPPTHSRSIRPLQPLLPYLVGPTGQHPSNQSTA